MLKKDFLFVGGEWVEPNGSDRIDVTSPITEESIGSVPMSEPADVDMAVAAAQRVHAEGEWRRLSIKERAAYLTEIARLLEPRIEEAVRLQVDEMGAPYRWIKRQTEGRILGVQRYIDDALALETREMRDGPAGTVLVDRQPVGVVAAVIPWNGPVPLVLGKIYPALLAGCPVIVKPAPETPLSAYLVAEAAVEAGLPKGLLSILPGGRELGEYLISHPGVDRVSFTGSTAAGRRIASICGDRLTRTTLELGGKSAAVLLDDVDLDAHLPLLIDSSLPNNGQVCHATTRILVPRLRSAEVTERLVEAVSQMQVGNPHDEGIDVGPLVSDRQRDRVESYIEVGVREGATIVCGGRRPDIGMGWYVTPTIFSGVSNSMKIAREEIFGPVLCLIEYDTVDEAIDIANDSEYGLGGAVFTSDVKRGVEVASRIETGTCRINEGLSGGGGGPFGGVKHSGLGREYSREGIESFYEIKSITLPLGFDPAEL
ncbi:aldehyde dehydrogenase [Rhodococcus globerulus]|uniref:aldehyde dehydrogenase n=1 Tax=Rhodococcus globerulus TaxID=33008 RepID=UPI001C59F019|nr:aldehyde dehydrogenase [Rhodococcus globerulus]QXW01328.1 aldehyde dehydrogenase [Rhodococcus globerulus]